MGILLGRVTTVTPVKSHKDPDDVININERLSVIITSYKVGWRNILRSNSFNEVAGVFIKS